MNDISTIQARFKEWLDSYTFPLQPAALYDPMSYIMSLGGKRVRPVLLLAAHDLYASELSRAFEAALAIEVFHNFTLLHDDIMDDADIRRGHPTVHVKYDESSAILTGDVMMICAYEFLEKYEHLYLQLCRVFNQTAREVCEGQSMDMTFETQEKVDIADYMKMIELKTSVLLAAALKMGGLIGGASLEDQDHLYEFGRNMGIAFQIQDDILDTFGTEELLGKKIGGDIKQQKKTYLYLKALELLGQDDSERLSEIFNQEARISSALVKEVKDLFNASHVKVHAEELKLVYQQLALSHLAAVSVPNEKKIPLKDLAKSLLDRTV